ncbi:MAG: hypothetical protein WBD27_05390 [Pyrinomonadaceae bacterium]
MKFLKIIAFVTVLTGLSAAFTFAQKARLKPAAKVRPIIFAVIFDGKTIEPIAYIEKGKLTQPPGGDEESQKLKNFAGTYYKPKTTYNLIFGGVIDGTVVVVKSSIGECSGNSAEITARPLRAKLKGFVMALATNAPLKTKVPGVRRLPTVDERNQAEKLVRAEFTRQNVSAASLKQLRYHNLTAIDVDRDGKTELIGSYWVSQKPTERSTLFFIAKQNAEGSYSFELSEFKNYTPDEIMSGDPKDLDDGIYHELFLDYFDYNGDGVAEIFTTTQAFEGRNFSIYRRESGKWVKDHESYNYRCGY